MEYITHLHDTYVYLYCAVYTHQYLRVITIYTMYLYTLYIHYTVIPNLQATEADEELFEDNPTDYIRKDMEGSDIGKGRYVYVSCICAVCIYCCICICASV